MAFELTPLPYAEDALAPHLSAETLAIHHGKHHRTYVETLNKLIAEGPHAGHSLEQIILESDGTIFNNAAQVWNHDFYWRCMKPGGGGRPTGDLAQAIERDLGGFAKLEHQLGEAAQGRFGSGWAWLVVDQSKLAVISTQNADLPLKHGQRALLAIDVWEHAYYVDYRNERPKYVEAFLTHLVDWDAVAARFRE